MTMSASGPITNAALGAGTVFDGRRRWLLFAGFALLVIFRLPEAWTHGRFLDEEGTVFFAYAWHRPWLDALFRPFGGYWNLFANATTLLVVTLVKGGVVPLERAPYCTMAAALVAQLLPALLILTGRAPWLAGRRAVVAALLIVVSAPATEEVFLNVLHTQFHLTLCAALILAFDAPRRRLARIAYGTLLFVAPLCGPGAIVLLPLFFMRALIDRDARRAAQLAALVAGAAVQLLLFYGASPVRGHVDPATVAAMMFVRLIALPMLNFGSADRFGAAIHASQAGDGAGWWWSVGIALILFGALVVVAARRKDAAIWLVLSALSLAAASFGFGMVVTRGILLFHPGAGERYQFLPLVLLGFALIALAMRRSRGRPIYAALCLLMLLTGAIRYPAPSPEFRSGPSWPAEVAAWRRDHRHALAVWPRPWTADLSDTSQSCSPTGRDLTRSTAPRYCESGWMAGFFRPSRPGPSRPEP